MFWHHSRRITSLKSSLRFVVLVMGWWLYGTCNYSLLFRHRETHQQIDWLMLIITSPNWFICGFAPLALYDTGFDHAVLYRICFFSHSIGRSWLLDGFLLGNSFLLIFLLLLKKACSWRVHTAYRFLKFVRNFNFLVALFRTASFVALFWATYF